MSALERPSIVRRPTRAVIVGGIRIGGGAPIVVQSATSTGTADIAATVTQVKALADVGCDLVRLGVHTADEAAAVPQIRDRLDAIGCHVPLIGHLGPGADELLNDFPQCARALAKYRIDAPGAGQGVHFRRLIERAVELDKPVRINVSPHGAERELLTRLMDQNAREHVARDARYVVQQALVATALHCAQSAEALGLRADRLIVACEMPDVQDSIAVYADLAARCDYPLHVALEPPGSGPRGIVASTAALAVLLQQGIGDTIHVSLGGDMTSDPLKNAVVAQEILQTMGLRPFSPLVSACPGCGRTSSVVFQELADNIQTWLRTQMPAWRRRYPGVETMSVAVMGCVVNGPGESRMADIGISLPGAGEVPVAPVYVDGEKTVTLKGRHIAEDFQAIVHDYVRARYGGEPPAVHLRPVRRSITLVPRG